MGDFAGKKHHQPPPDRDYIVLPPVIEVHAQLPALLGQPLLIEVDHRRDHAPVVIAKAIMMCELPSNAILADEFLEYFDGFSIGSNDLTQLTLGLDRDSGIIAHLFDERNPAVKKLLANAIAACNKAGKYIGICGQGPSDHPDLAKWLMEQGIESVSLNPDSVLETWFFLAEGQGAA